MYDQLSFAHGQNERKAIYMTNWASLMVKMKGKLYIWKIELRSWSEWNGKMAEMVKVNEYIQNNMSFAHIGQKGYK